MFATPHIGNGKPSSTRPGCVRTNSRSGNDKCQEASSENRKYWQNTIHEQNRKKTKKTLRMILPQRQIFSIFVGNDRCSASPFSPRYSFAMKQHSSVWLVNMSELCAVQSSLKWSIVKCLPLLGGWEMHLVAKVMMYAMMVCGERLGDKSPLIKIQQEFILAFPQRISGIVLMWKYPATR